MSRDEAEQAAARWRLALAMHEDGVEMYRQKLRRDDPSASEQTISERVAVWLRRDPEVEWPFRVVAFGSPSTLKPL